ncbi:hypothetical protein LTR37_019141 [Vermiconidia calcicola]|uniref:Uncharacterized protein n=1 Tax=Vermiconidia calcicola TaxID=1690605 RepID=A0ACC3MG40_9PEZI|nr:hypothetical protein LTR37_019141 [Vermiconidia calcicola]
MLIEKLYVYPIKSLRAVPLDSATLTRFGFHYDRDFMILQVNDENGDKTLKNMTIAAFNQMVRFFQEVDNDRGTFKVTYEPVDGGESKHIDIPLAPDTSELEVIDIEMHKSPTKAYKMDEKYNDWLSECFGYETVLAYIGENVREVRMSSDRYKTNSTNGASNGAGGWLSSVTSVASKATGLVLGNGSDKPSEIKFADCAPYLVVSSKSMDDVHSRLSEGEEFDIIKFRPNVIVSGAEQPWEEDYWAELTVGGQAKLECEHNCPRCVSINIDYNTGAQGTGETGAMLKKLSKDRRVDPGMKWSPIFGRYTFVHPESEGQGIKVGDEVVVSRKNTDHTAFDWKGLSTLPEARRS